MTTFFDIRNLRSLANASIRSPAAIQRARTEGLNRILEVAFHASLLKDEGRFHDLSILVSPPTKESKPQKREKTPNQIFFESYLFEMPLPYTASNLRACATALHKTSASIHVEVDANGLPRIMGFGRVAGNAGWLIESIHAGKLRFTSSRGVRFSGATYIEWDPLAIIDGNNIHFLSDYKVSRMLSRELLTSKLFTRFDDPSLSDYEYSTIGHDYSRLIEKMLEHGHGGTAMFVSSSGWKRSAQKPLSMQAKSPYREAKTWALRRGEWSKQLAEGVGSRFSSAPQYTDDAIDLIGRLTALDGATILSTELEVFAFGVKLRPVNLRRRPESIVCFLPFKDSSGTKTPIDEFGGMRHQSAAQFVFDHPDAVAIVASQDNRASLIYWNTERNELTAIRHVEYM